MKKPIYNFKFLLKGVKSSLLFNIEMDELIIYQEAATLSRAEDKLKELMTKQYLKADKYILQEIKLLTI